jgi:hypothetical protein
VTHTGILALRPILREKRSHTTSPRLALARLCRRARSIARRRSSASLRARPLRHAPRIAPHRCPRGCPAPAVVSHTPRFPRTLYRPSERETGNPSNTLPSSPSESATTLTRGARA